MRATNHSSREWGLARHNDRDFDIEKADHIDPGKQDENYYWNYYGDQELTFQQAELRFYEEAFQGMLQDINAKAAEADQTNDGRQKGVIKKIIKNQN